MKGPALRSLLLPLVPIYWGVITVKNWLLDRGVLPQRRLGHPVISVGSLSAGGAGKTPVVIMLAEMFGRNGFEVRILTRGHRREGTAIQWVDPAGDAREFGDEPLLMARRLPAASVWVGADRYRAGRMSERGEAPGSKVVYLLDDGFQHRKLARDVDIALVTRRDVEDGLLPAGNLRETLKAARRADILVVREAEAEVAGLPGAKGMWLIRRRLEFPKAAPARPVAFCGVARPEGFLSMLASEGVAVAARSVFQDHHRYSEHDVDRLVKMARANHAEGFLTTEKDAVKLTAGMMERLERVGPVVVPRLRVELVDEAAKVKELFVMLGAACG